MSVDVLLAILTDDDQVNHGTHIGLEVRDRRPGKIRDRKADHRFVARLRAADTYVSVQTISLHFARHVWLQGGRGWRLASDFYFVGCRSRRAADRLMIGVKTVGSAGGKRVSRCEISRGVALGMQMRELVQAIANDDQVDFLLVDDSKVLEHLAIRAMNHHF